MPAMKTSDKILEISRELLASGGLGAVSFDAIARRLGRSKQAVLYWFPTKMDLLASLYLPWLKAEAEAVTASVAGARNRNDAVAAFVRATVSFHLEDLNRFRMMYLVPQTIKSGAGDALNGEFLDQVHSVTDRIYATLANHLEGDRLSARREAVAIHAAVLGLVLMFGLAGALHDPLKHSNTEIIDALIARLSAA